MKVLIALSGGLDSATMLAHYIHEGYIAEGVSFYYGSKHNDSEIAAAKEIAAHYSINHSVIDMSGVMKDFKSDLLLSGGVIPKGHYNDASMSRTVVPARNLIFASILTGLAQSKEIPFVALGVHQGDHHIYPDCRPEFIESLKYTALLASDGKVRIIAPFLTHSKADIVKLGLSLQTPYHFTRTCYEGLDNIACGKCGSCVERLEAFRLNESIDPILYINDEF